MVNKYAEISRGQNKSLQLLKVRQFILDPKYTVSIEDKNV